MSEGPEVMRSDPINNDSHAWRISGGVPGVRGHLGSAALHSRLMVRVAAWCTDLEGCWRRDGGGGCWMEAWLICFKALRQRRGSTVCVCVCVCVFVTPDRN